MDALGIGFLLSFSALGSKFFDSCLRYDARGFWKAKQRTTHKAVVPVHNFVVIIEIYDKEQRGHPLKPQTRHGNIASTRKSKASNAD